MTLPDVIDAHVEGKQVTLQMRTDRELDESAVRERIDGLDVTLESIHGS